MGLDEIQQIVDIATKPKEKTENRKILVIIICAMVPTILIGIDLGNWHEWRNATETRINRIESWKETMQTSANNERAVYNRNIKIK